MHKKFFIYGAAILALLLTSSVANASPVSWDGDFANQILQPLSTYASAVIKGNHFVATSTIPSIFPLASTTALSATTLCLSTDCRTVWPGGTPGGLNLQVQYNNAGVFGGISGAVTNGTILNLTNPLIGGGTLTTSSVNGVTLTAAGSATTFLDGTGAYSVPVGTGITALTGDITASGPGSAVATLATVNSNVGSFTCASLTANAKGLITAASNGSCGSGGGSISTSSPLVAGQVIYATSPSTIASIATSTPSLGTGLSYSGTLGNFIGGTSGTLSISTTSLYTGTTGQVAYFNGTNSLIGTSTIFISPNRQVVVGGFGTVPQQLFDIQGNVAGSEASSSNIGFTYAAAPTQYSNSIRNLFSGVPANHSMAFYMRQAGTETNPLTFFADGRAVFNYKAIFNQDVGINIGGNIPVSALQVSTSTLNNVQNFSMSGASNTAYRSGFISNYGGSSLAQNNVEFYITQGIDSIVRPIFFASGDARVNFGSTTLPTSGFNITGIAGLNPFSISSSTGANYVTLDKFGDFGIGTTTPSYPLTVQGSLYDYGAYSHFGSTTPLAQCNTVMGASTCLEVVGNDNTVGGTGEYISNISSGASAYTGVTLLNNSVSNATTNYSGLFLNGSNYNDTTFGSANNVPSLLQLANAQGPLSIQSFGSTTASSYINFYAVATVPGSGISTSSEVMRITSTGLGIGTTTPSKKLTISGDEYLTGGLFDSIFSAGTLGMVLQSTGTSTRWVATSTLGISGGTSLTGSTGQLGYFSGTNTFTATSSIFLSSTGFLGLGTTTPSALLSIHDSTGAVGTIPEFTVASSTSSGTATTTLFTVLGNGNVGIGTSSPVSGLSVQTPAIGGTASILLARAGATDNRFFRMTDTSASGRSWDFINRAMNNAGWFGIFDNTAGQYRMVFDTSGRIGIGSSTPSAPLSVSSAAIGAGTLPMFSVSSTTNANLFIVLGNGNVGVSSTSPVFKLSVNGTVGATGLTTSASVQQGILCISSTGEFINESVACVASAKRYKENIQNLSVGLDELMQLQPITFTWKKDFLGGNADDPNQNGIQYSLIADDVQKIDPNLVSLTTATTTFEGQTYAPGTVNGLADLNHWVALIVKSIQDLSNKQDATNATQDARLDALEAQVSALQGENGQLKHMCVMN